jgi:hypothetical protein
MLFPRKGLLKKSLTKGLSESGFFCKTCQPPEGAQVRHRVVFSGIKIAIRVGFVKAIRRLCAAGVLRQSSYDASFAVPAGHAPFHLLNHAAKTRRNRKQFAASRSVTECSTKDLPYCQAQLMFFPP